MRIDFQAWAGANLTVEHMGDNGEWTCICPKCGKAKLAVNVVKAVWQCWTCKFSGRDPRVLVGSVLGLSPEEAAGVACYTGSHEVITGKIEPLTTAKQERRIITTAPLPPGCAPLQGIAESYARKRGIPDHHARLFGLSSVLGDGSGSLADRMLTGRLLIPAFLDGRVVYWQARATDDSDIKTLNLPSEDRLLHWGLSPTPGVASKREVLVGIHTVERGKPAILVEGSVDAVVGGPRFVSPLGAGLSPEQAALLASRQPSEVVILFDPDEAGRKGAERAHARLSPYLPVSIGECPAGTDPADLGRERCLRIVAEYVGRKLPPLGISRHRPRFGLRRLKPL